MGWCLILHCIWCTIVDLLGVNRNWRADAQKLLIPVVSSSGGQSCKIVSSHCMLWTKTEKADYCDYSRLIQARWLLDKTHSCMNKASAFLQSVLSTLCISETRLRFFTIVIAASSNSVQSTLFRLLQTSYKVVKLIPNGRSETFETSRPVGPWLDNTRSHLLRLRTAFSVVP